MHTGLHGHNWAQAEDWFPGRAVNNLIIYIFLYLHHKLGLNEMQTQECELDHKSKNFILQVENSGNICSPKFGVIIYIVNELNPHP